MSIELANIDLWIVLGYLITTLVVGYVYGKGTKNIAIFATGGRSFSTGVLAATIIATYVSGSSFIIGITQGYQDGLLKFFVTSGTLIGMLTTAYVLVPRMSEFLGDLSVADSMRKLYGSEVGLVTSFCGLLLCVGGMTMQIKILSSTFAYFSQIPINLSVVLCAVVMVVYSMSGGIRAVIFTDVMQFLTFMIVVPAMAIGLWYGLVNKTEINATSEIYKHAMSFKAISGADYLTLAIYFLMPELAPAFFQRLTISRNTKQATDALKFSAVMYLVYIFIAAMTGIMLFVYQEGLAKDQIFPVLLDQFTYPGLKGLTFVAIIAMAMSTSDSHLNSFAVIFSHDVCKNLGLIKTEKSELRFAQFATVLIGILSVLMAIYFQDLISLLLFVKNFYMPIVWAPLILAILGFRPHSRVVLMSMAFGFSTVILWKGIQSLFPGILRIDSLIPATIVNLISMMIFHHKYALGGGWVGPKDSAPLELMRVQKERKIKHFIGNINGLISALCFKQGNLLKISTNNTMRALIGFLIITTYFAVTISDPTIAVEQKLIYWLQFPSCIIGSLLMISSLWSNNINEKYAVPITFYSLVYIVSSNMLLMYCHAFSNISVINFVATVCALGFFGRVFVSISVLFMSYFICGIIYNNIYGMPFVFETSDFIFVIIYSLCIMTFMMLAFFGRQQIELEVIKDSKEELAHVNNILRAEVSLREENLKKSSQIRRDILRNVNHEVRTPMHGAQMSAHFLSENWNKPNFYEIAEEAVVTNKESVDRLYRYVSNLLDLSNYQNDKILFNIKAGNFKQFLERHSERYENVLLKYSDDIPEMIEFDEVKMAKLFEELIDNADAYSDGAVIEIFIEKGDEIFLNNKSWERLKISIKDRGVGIPEDELKSVFEPFYISKRTGSFAGGKGLGLAIVNEIISGHIGEIMVKNNKDHGLTVVIYLPILHPKSNFLVSNSCVEEVQQLDVGRIIERISSLKDKFSGRVPRVLMIEDEAIVRDMGGLMVTSFGYQFHGISTGHEALEYIMSDEFNADIILLDMMLGDTDGLKIMQKIHKKLAKKRVPVIIQSGLSAGDEVIEAALQLGAKCLISKPYNKKSLHDILKKYLKLD